MASFIEGACKQVASAVVLERRCRWPATIARLKVENARGAAGRLASVLLAG
jgi:hypothetical protein